MDETKLVRVLGDQMYVLLGEVTDENRGISIAVWTATVKRPCQTHIISILTKEECYDHTCQTVA